MNRLRPLGLLLLVLVLPACGGADPVQKDQVVTYVATDVVWLEGEEPIEEVVVSVGAGSVDMRAACNTLHRGGARVDRGRLKGGTVSTTDMGCGSDVATRQDDWLAELLAADPEIRVASDRVELRSSDAVLTAVRQA